MGLRGLVDSPLDQSENLQLLSRIERQLRLTGDNLSDTEVSTFDAVDHWSSPAPDLWTLVLDVIFAPLSIRIQAAELLTAISIATDDGQDSVVQVDASDVHKLRAIVSSTCQALEELDATDVHQATQLFTWLGFLERVLLATQSDVCVQVFHNSMYAGMLTKMLRLLSVCSTKVFAAITICLALFHSHERQCGRAVLVGEVLHDMKDGREHLGGALLHVINSCGCPCPKERLVHLWNSVQLFGDILTDETASALVFVNDLKILIDLVIRECTDLPQEDPTRLYYLELLERILGSSLYLQAQIYRKRDLWTLLESLLDAGAEEGSLMAKDVTDKTKQILVRYVDLLD
ncbi:hypothetical protein PHYBOEH_002148 [Phytophthora boehmeriae]|uniref:SPIN90/Ldb17 leucine-rich domain-containing protein n=1 Tax=Phytophthora boehmeriae TaxID=109152 RepID=A0A8T1WSU5_9STRA|nr:hypothetical protein PHYBOEH_002148 [Phytophthora boehmeriae]